MAAATVRSYRTVLNGIWRPKIGHLSFPKSVTRILYAIADGHAWSKNTYNNLISVCKRAFDFGYRNRPPQEKPSSLPRVRSSAEKRAIED